MTPVSRLFDLGGRTALVSGAGRGMGLGIARALARQGATVLVNDFHPDRAEAAASALRAEGLAAHAAAADMADRMNIFVLVERVAREVAPVDIFVHNAGIPAQGWGYAPFLESPPEEWDAWLRLNLLGFMHACQALLPSMVARRWGRVVGINSDAARTATGMGLCAYGAAKAGALGFVRNLSGEVGRHGITVNALVAGHDEQLGRRRGHGAQDHHRRPRRQPRRRRRRLRLPGVGRGRRGSPGSCCR
jgi:2-hydroxycyclohexanecarboxyl-CoA dehydrogenase